MYVMLIERRVIVSGAWSVCKLLHQSRSQKELVDKLKLGIWRIVNKGSNYTMVGRVQKNKQSTCLEADVRGFFSNPRPQWQEESW